jgi:hypothetical protein
MLRSLNMYGMAQAIDELAQQGAPAYRDLAGFDFASSEVNEAMVSDFVEPTDNVVLVGGPDPAP